MKIFLTVCVPHSKCSAVEKLGMGNYKNWFSKSFFRRSIQLKRTIHVCILFRPLRFSNTDCVLCSLVRISDLFFPHTSILSMDCLMLVNNLWLVNAFASNTFTLKSIYKNYRNIIKTKWKKTEKQKNKTKTKNKNKEKQKKTKNILIKTKTNKPKPQHLDIYKHVENMKQRRSSYAG